MLKNIKKPLLIIVILITNLSVSQNTFEDLNTRNKIEKITQEIKTQNGISRKIDSTIIKVDSTKLDFVKDFKFFDDFELKYNYTSSVFTRKSSVIHQFIKPLKIYLDIKIPDSIRTKFKTFVLNIPKIKNLEISFTNDIESSNYYIKLNKTNFYGIRKKDLEEFEKDEQKHLVFQKMTYTILNDENKNGFGCLIKISPDMLNQENCLTKLKKAFYVTLGNFSVLSEGAPKGSVLDFETTEIDNLINSDIELLKVNYQFIYDFKVSQFTFYKLGRLYKKSKK